jgi:hypothetical protein
MDRTHKAHFPVAQTCRPKDLVTYAYLDNVNLLSKNEMKLALGSARWTRRRMLVPSNHCRIKKYPVASNYDSYSAT